MLRLKILMMHCTKCVIYESLVANSKYENDEIHGHTCEDPHTDEWLDVVTILNV